MMGLYWIKSIIKARCHAEGVPIAFNSEEEKELASAKHSGAASNEIEIHINPIVFDEYIKAVSGGGEAAYPAGKPVDMPMGRAKLNADPTNQQAEAWRKICALLDELRPGWIDGNIKGVDSALKTIATMAEKADFAEVKPDLYLTGFQWKDSQGAWQFALGPAGSAWYESQGFKTRFVYVTQKD
ncbi:MAG TPA: hypothetical protein K8V46_03250, partial [Alcaligenes faecalis]